MAGKEGYIKIFKYLEEIYLKKSSFSLLNISDYSGLKTTSMKTYIRNKLKDKFISNNNGMYIVLKEITEYDEKSFCNWMSQKTLTNKEKSDLSSNLLENSIQSMLASIEIHNKPQISYRYQVVIILIINSWELAMKAYISKYQPKTKLIKNDGTSKTFLECLRNIETNIGKKLSATIKNLEVLYKYRCDYIHFYNDCMDIMIFSLIQKSVVFYNKFITIYFNRSLSDNDDIVFFTYWI